MSTSNVHCGCGARLVVDSQGRGACAVVQAARGFSKITAEGWMADGRS
jgi:hypothetical protein